MKRLHSFLSLCFIVCSFTLKTQNLAAYSDYKNYFFTFDAGTKTGAEYLPVQSFQVGGNAVAYIDNTDNLKVVYQGVTTKLSDGIITKFLASDYLVSYSIYQMLKVFDSGKIIPLTNFAQTYSTGDSLVAFYENRTYSFKIYYKGAIITLEEGITENPVQNFMMGDNLFAYVNYLNQFKLFYRGESMTLTTLNRGLPYAAGKNIMVYCNDNYAFTAFYKGLSYDLETVQPKSFAAGDDLAAYVTANEEFKVFYDGKPQLINSFEPLFYKVEDSIVVYNELGKFKAFYRGAVYPLESYIPTDFVVDFNTILYTDQQGRLKIFQSGKSSLITNSRVDAFDLYRNVVSYKVLNRNYIYYNSKIYPQ